VFERLTPLYRTNNQNGKTMWKCKCECGNLIIAEQYNLTSGHTKSCGCLSKLDLTNKRFGKLVALEPTDKRNGSQIVWKCQCDCGNIKEVMGNMLKSGQVSSCGHCLSSLGEYQISQILDENNIFYQQDIVLPELYQETGRRLRFDFILYDNDLLTPIRMIEFDGRQHTKGPEAIWSNSDSLEVIQERDNIKNQFCLSHNYPLVRIPYTKLSKITLNDLLGDQYLVKGDDFSDTH
jgi:hypothetical protein